MPPKPLDRSSSSTIFSEIDQSHAKITHHEHHRRLLRNTAVDVTSLKYCRHASNFFNSSREEPEVFFRASANVFTFNIHDDIIDGQQLREIKAHEARQHLPVAERSSEIVNREAEVRGYGGAPLKEQLGRRVCKTNWRICDPDGSALTANPGNFCLHGTDVYE